MVNETNNVPAVGQMGAWYSHLDETKRGLAKLLARENIVVEHVAGLATADFDLQTRTLRLPMWTGISVDQYDLLIGHEVGHAKYSDDLESLADKSMTKGLHTFINVLEDTRIERLMQAEFPGLRGAFRRGYQDFFARGPIFQLEKPVAEYSFIDRINIHYKIGHCVTVPFSDDERAILPRIDALRTMREAVTLARELYGKAKEQKKESPKPEEKPAQGAPEQGGDSSDSEQTEQSAGESDDQNDSEAGNGNVDGESTDADDDSTEESDPVSETDTANADGLAKMKGVSERDAASQPEQLTLGTLTMDQCNTVMVPTKTFVADTLSIYKRYDMVATAARTWLDASIAKHTKPVAQMAMEFDRKKNAKRLEHARVSRSGRLDLNKLHAFKYREDLFQSVIHLPNGQNHGIVMLIDGSASMGNVFTDTMEQALLFGLFAKRVNVPLRAFIFTQNRMGTSTREDRFARFARTTTGTIIPNLTASLVQVLDTTDAKTWKDQMYAFAGFATRYSPEHSTSYHGYLPYTNLGSTPLHTSMLVADTVVAEMKRALKLEKMTVLICTDGDDTDALWYRQNASHVQTDYYGVKSTGFMPTSSANWFVRDRVTKQVYTNFKYNAEAAKKYGACAGYERIENSEFSMLVDMLHRRHDARVVAIKLAGKRGRHEANTVEMGNGFFVPHVHHESGTLYTAAQVAAAGKSWADNGVAVLPKGCTSCDAAIVVATNTLSVIDAEEAFKSAIDGKEATARQVARAFAKANVNAAGNKLFIGAVMPFIA